MKVYLDLINHVLEKGSYQKDRTGVGTISIFGVQSRFCLKNTFPCLTTKKLHLRSIIHELLWFLKGDTNIKYLNNNKVSIWDEWADENGDLGPVYGKQWRSWSTNNQSQSIDQINNVIQSIKKNPTSRRHIVSAWNPSDIDKMALAPCHALFQFNVNTSKNELNCQLYQRSADLFLGVPFNIVSYSLLTMMIAQVCDLIPGEFIHTFGDLHLYKNHIEQAKKQLNRTPRNLPSMIINKNIKNIDDFKFEDFNLINYDPHPAIPAPIAI